MAEQERMVMLKIGAVADASNVEAVGKVEQELHDDIVRALAGKRRDPVMWMHYKATDAGLFERIEEAGLHDPYLVEFCDSAPDGLVIVTSCEYLP